MAMRLRVALAAVFVAAALVTLGAGIADAQRGGRRSPAPQARQAVPRPPIQARPVPGGRYYYRGPTIYRPYYARPYYWYGGVYGGYAYPFYFSPGIGPYAPYYYGYPYPYHPYAYAYDLTASLRLRVTPRVAEVFIDGSYAGTVDDFDGSFQSLRLDPGTHAVDIFLPGHHTLTQNVYLQPGKTFTVRGALEPLAPGEPEPQPPSSRGARSEFGILALHVQPGNASVTIDGELWETSGDARLLILQLGSGVHMIEIHKEGYRPYVGEFTVRPGETTTLNVAMTSSGS